MNNRMYQVNFEPKSRKICSVGFNLSASSIEEAEKQATYLMKKCGESLHHFKRPVIKMNPENYLAE